jgi:hypothetical protein
VKVGVGGIGVGVGVGAGRQLTPASNRATVKIVRVKMASRFIVHLLFGI